MSTPTEDKYAIDLYFGRGKAEPPEPPEEWEPTYPNQWSWASNPQTRQPIEPQHSTPILPYS